ncbi:MAG TPA: DUF1472 domain-containing protein [Desulfobacteraceae bacterium]|nr:DUF1472 domain-containing protein [Desulfobacteraceae bacterium]
MVRSVYLVCRSHPVIKSSKANNVTVQYLPPTVMARMKAAFSLRPIHQAAPSGRVAAARLSSRRNRRHLFDQALPCWRYK